MALLVTILTWTGLVVGGLIALAVLCLLILFVSSLFTGFSPKGVELELSCPALVALDQPFTIGVTVRNLLDRERLFRSLDFDNSLLQGFVIRQIEPNARENSSGLGTTTHYYTLPIPPRAHVHFAISCHAVAAGDHSGEVMAYVDHKHAKYVSKVLRLVIR